MSDQRRRQARLAAAVLVALMTVGLAACSSTSRHLGAAEPAKAPTPAVPAAGTVRPVGADPEGLAYDPATSLLAVAVHSPDRLLLLDPDTLQVRRAVLLPGSARHLQLAASGGPVLVPLETSDELAQVALPNGSLTLTHVGKQPHDAAASGRLIVVGNEFGHSISVIAGARVTATLGGIQQPGGLVGDGDVMAAVDVARFIVDTFDLQTDRMVASVPAGAGPTHAVLDNAGQLVVADTRGNAVLTFAVSPLRMIARLPLPGTPYGMAFDAVTDTVWVTLTALDQVVGLHLRSGTPVVTARYPTVQQPNTVAVAPGSHTLWITGTAAGTVEQITR